FYVLGSSRLADPTPRSGRVCPAGLDRVDETTQRGVMTMNIHEFAHQLPKAELHVHLEGTLEPEMKFELARRNGIELSERTPEEVKANYDFDDLTSFLAAYYPAMDVLRTA